MSFDIFGPSQKDAISVGYISTDRGYIQNVNVKDANLYAQKNPGTQFIFTTRNFVKYLNINEVNKLTPDDLLVNEKTCEGIVIEKEGGPAKALFYGGGGVGAQGNPIIGTDGAVLAIDLIAGGFGYQYEPIVVVKDDTGVGAGAVIRAVLGEVIETVEYFDQESDFEIYDTGGSNTGSGTGSGDGGYNTGAGGGGGTGAGSGGFGAGAGSGGFGAGAGAGGSGVTGASIISGGSGYTNANISFSVPQISGGSAATATATISSGAITAINITSGGSGYTTANISFSVPQISGGSAATATATISSGAITAINITSGGSGYTTAPIITITGDGSAATATATISSGAITAINITSGGSGYTTAPIITITGDGSAATATATISSSGAITAINITSGGSGYTTAPIITITGDGSAATATAIIGAGSGGSGDATLSLFGSEGPPAALGSAEVDAEYGLRYDASGNILGKWDPTLYTNLDKDPIRKEIQKYQDFIQKIGNAWWTTRKNPPIVVTSRYRTSKIIYNVTDATYLDLYKKRGLVNITGWSDFLNTYAVSPVSPSNVPGSDFAGIEFTLEWEELFPYDGEYVFRAQADNIGRFYLDNQKILETTEFRQDQTPKIIKKTIKAGVHRIRIDLYNSPVMEKVVKNQAVQPINDNYPCPGTKDMRGYNDYPGTLEGQSNQFGLDNDYPSAKSQGFTDADIRCYLEKIYLKIPGKRLGPKMQEVLKDPNWGIIGSIPLQKPHTIKTSYSGLNAVKNNFKAGIYKISASYYKGIGPSGIAIIIKNKASGKLVFDSLKNIGGANIKLLPVVKNILGVETASAQYKLDDFSKNSEESKIFLRNSGVFPENVKDNSTTNIEWKNIYFTEDGEYEISVSVDESITIDIAAESGLVPLNPLPTSNSIKSTGTKTKKVFNTVDYIDKSDRKLWRFDPRAGRDSEFINQYGILPFDPNSESAKIESFSGIHVIRWQFVEFPVDGNYNVEIMVDDSVVVYIGNRDGSGRQEIGNGLTDINEGGDETIFRKSGSGKSFETRYFKSGKYRIRVELEQSNIAAKIKDMRGYNDYPGTDQGAPNQFGYLNDYPSARSQGFTDADIRYYLEKVYKGSIGPDMKRVLSDPNWGRQGLTALALGNPMGFAMNIELSYIEEDVVSSKSWNENPMGAALIIDAPNPPIPQEPIPLQEGRCPRNPIWTTRFPGAKEQWIPVNYVAKDPNQASWSSFTNRYAISPVRPLSTPGSDSGGIVYRNSWDLDLPYDGFYAFKSTVDNAGRILIDGIPIMQANYIPIVYRNTKGGSGQEQRSGISAIDGGIIYNWRNNNPKSKKIFLTKGVHKIEVEVENGITESFAIINKKIFSTSDWKYSSIGNGTKDMRGYNDYPGTPEGQPNQFGFDNDYPSAKSQGFTDVDIRYYLETVYLKIPGKRLGPKMQKVLSDPTWGQLPSQGLLKGTTKDGVTYEGPTPIANYNFDDISPLLQDVNAFPNDEIQGKTWVFRWSKVNFPEDGEYNISIESDDSIVIFIGNNSKNGEIEISNGLNDINDGGDETIFRRSKSNNPGKSFETRYFKAGRYRIRVELTNISVINTGFQQNPTYFSLNITKSIRSSTGLSYSWAQNPMGIAAIMIPPPCPKIIKGKGVITKIIVDDPGNSYPPPPPADPPLPAALEPAAVLLPDQGPLDRYPVCLILDEVIVEDSGINYNCGVDKLQIIPDNGVILDYNCDTFGRISEVKILNNGTCFSSYPNIFLPTDTGINATFRPVFRVVRDPVDLDLKDKLIQVTDLVGLKLTGYLEGRPYYGAVFYDNDIRFAGYYKTIGKPLQIYDTLQESIDSQVVTPPSAIQRQGTDISSNDPRLNIPGTPGEII